MADHTCATCRHGSRELWQIVRPPDDPRHTVVYCHHPACVAAIGGVEIMYADEGTDCGGYEAGQQVQQMPLLTPGEREHILHSITSSWALAGIDVSSDVAERALDRALERPLPDIGGHRGEGGDNA